MSEKEPELEHNYHTTVPALEFFVNLQSSKLVSEDVVANSFFEAVCTVFFGVYVCYIFALALMFLLEVVIMDINVIRLPSEVLRLVCSTGTTIVNMQCG